jgi:hypothetical protein
MAAAVAGSAAGAMADVGGKAASAAPGEPAGRSVFNVRDFGAAGNGEAKDTAAIQKAIDACSHARGGLVYFPAGTYLTGTIRLKSNVILYLHVSATIQGSKQLADYDLFGEICPASECQAQPRYLIYAKDAQNIGIMGQGKIDGSGRSFWRLMTKAEIEEVLLQRPEGGRVAQDWYRWLDRPAQMIEFEDCKNVRLESIRLENAPFWTVHPLRCESVFIDGITIHNPLYGNNLDGIDPDGCSNVMISNCNVYTCDDAVCVKNGNYGAQVSPWRSKDITVTNCVLCTTCNAIKIDGIDPDNSIENVTFSNCALYGDRHPQDTGNTPFWPDLQDFRPMSGIHIDVPSLSGSVLGVNVSNIVMEDVRNPIFMRLTRTGEDAGPETGGTIRDVMIDNVLARRQGLTCVIAGLPGRDIENISLSNVRVTGAQRGTLAWAKREFIPESQGDYPDSWIFGNLPSHGLYCRHVNGLRLRSVEYVLEEPDMRPALMFDDVRNLDIDGFAAMAPPSGMPVIRLKQVSRAFLRGCSAPPGTGTYLQVEGEDTEKICVMGNDLSEAGKPISLEDGVKSNALFESGNRMPPA